MHTLSTESEIIKNYYRSFWEKRNRTRDEPLHNIYDSIPYLLNKINTKPKV